MREDIIAATYYGSSQFLFLYFIFSLFATPHFSCDTLVLGESLLATVFRSSALSHCLFLHLFFFFFGSQNHTVFADLYCFFFFFSRIPIFSGYLQLFTSSSVH